MSDSIYMAFTPVFEPTCYPAVFYSSNALNENDMYHFCIRVRCRNENLGLFDFIEISKDRYIMSNKIGQIIFISKQELEDKYHCIFAANGGYKIYKYILD